MALVVVAPMWAQHSPASEILLDARQPSVYIEFEHVEEPSGGNDETAVWLRLYNNTTWAISFRTESLYIGDKVRPLTLMNGKGALAIRPGTTVSPCYVVEEAPGDSSSTAGGIVIGNEPYRRLLQAGNTCTVGSTSWIPSGGFVRMLIPSEHLAVGRRISTSFEYEWEAARGLEHRVLFNRHW